MSLACHHYVPKMPDALKDLIDAGYNDGASAGTALLNARTHILNASIYVGQEDWSNAQIEFAAASDDFGYVFRYLIQDDMWYKGLRRDWRDALYWINDNWPIDGPAEVTMSAILSAMVTATGDELKYFIGLVDAYRSSLWEKPFNAEYFAALARGFMQG